MQKAFDRAPGAVSATAGYEGGRTKNPSYQEVETGRTGHAETALAVYDPKKTSCAQLADAYWRNIDPAAANQQLCDHGTQDRSIIFYGNAAEQRIALQSKLSLAPAGAFTSRLQRKSGQLRLFIVRKTATRRITQKILCNIKPIALAADALRGSGSSGAAPAVRCLPFAILL